MNEMTTISREQRPYSDAAKKALSRKPALFINNEWVASSHDATIPVEDPSTGKEVSRVVDASDRDVDRAVAAARAAFDDGRWSNLPPMVRDRTMNRLADLLEAHADEFAELEAIDNGKPKGMAGAVDIPGAISQLRFMAGWASKVGGETTAPYTMPAGMVFSYTVKEPVGVCAQIVPWNFPLLMACLKIAPALAAGCTIVLKPAEQTSLTALRLADFIVEAGFPAGVINIITGNGHTAGDRMVKHPDVDKVAFTGSTEIGKLINRNATDTLKRVTLELGGKSPAVITPGYPIEHAVQRILAGKLLNAGQTCIAPDHVHLPRALLGEFVAAARREARRGYPGGLADAHLASIVNERQYHRLAGWRDEAQSRGARVEPLFEGLQQDDTRHRLAPQLLLDPPADTAVMREEIFGPLLPLVPYDRLEDAIAAVQAGPRPLALYWFDRDRARTDAALRALPAGGVTVNDTLLHIAQDGLPFGGVGASGMGHYHGRWGFDTFSKLVPVFRQSRLNGMALFLPPYGATMRRLLGLMKRW